MKVAIIGAGLSGLLIANILQKKAEVVVFDKALKVGGRMACRNFSGYCFDYGAQFFTAKSQLFQDFLKPYLEKNIIKIWHSRFVEFDENTIVNKWGWDNKYPHYIGNQGIDSLPKSLAENKQIYLNTRVTNIIKQDNKWIIYANETIYKDFDWVVITAPAEQSLDLVPDCFEYKKELDNIKMTSCFSLLLGFKQPLDIDFEAALVRNKNISWISKNSSKFDDAGNFSLLVHSTNKWATKNFDKDKNEIIDFLIKETSSLINQDLYSADLQSLFKWKYANISKQKNRKTLVDYRNNIAVSGDWCFQGRIESAFLSAVSVANHIADEIA